MPVTYLTHPVSRFIPLALAFNPINEQLSPSPQCTPVQMPPANVQNCFWCVLVLDCYSFIWHSVLPRYLCMCVSVCVRAHVCKLIISVGWRLEDILGTRAIARFFSVANEFSTWRVYNEPSFYDSLLWIMEQLINGGTSNVEHGDFIHLCSWKVLTVAQDITSSEDGVLYTCAML